MHLGNIFAAVLSWLSARKKGGAWILRIEDLDRQRCKKEFADFIIDDLRWLGLEWDGEIFFQSEREDFYKEAFNRLESEGLIYDCFCRRADRLAASAPHQNSEEGLTHFCRCKNLLPNEKESLLKARLPAKRVLINEPLYGWTDGHYGKQQAAATEEDFIIRRADGNFAYQLAVVVDDALTGITEVVRGADLLESTAQQIFLHKKLGCRPPQFFHIPLLVTKNGRRLSKRDKDSDMAFYRANLSPNELLGKVAHIAGLIEHEEPISLDDALAAFDWKKIPSERQIQIILDEL